MNLKHFSANEFRCRCGCGLSVESMQPDTLKRLDLARGYAGVPFIITSAVRCEAHNKAVGGVDDSSHTNGTAVDISADTSRSRYLILKSLMQAGFNRFGIYKTFIHADNDSSKTGNVCWHG